MKKETPRWVKWWITYISNRSWYRGAVFGEQIAKRVHTFWTPSRSAALSYARLRDGELIKAEIKPTTHLARGSDPDIAEDMGIYKRYMKLKLGEDEEKGEREAEVLVSRHLKRRGVQVQIIDKDQIVVLDPSIISEISRTPVKRRVVVTKKKRKVKRGKGRAEVTLKAIR